MQKDENLHLNDPLISLMTFRDGKTDRSSGSGGFKDSENKKGKGIKSSPIYGLDKENIIILSGHTIIKAKDISEKDIKNERDNGNNLRNDRQVSYYYRIKEKKITTIIAPQIIKYDKKTNKIVTCIHNSFEIVRNKIKEKTNKLKNNFIRIKKISKINKKKKLGVGYKKTTLNIDYNRKMSENLENSIGRLSGNEIELG